MNLTLHSAIDPLAPSDSPQAWMAESMTARRAGKGRGSGQPGDVHTVPQRDGEGDCAETYDVNQGFA